MNLNVLNPNINERINMFILDWKTQNLSMNILYKNNANFYINIIMYNLDRSKVLCKCPGPV